MAKGEAGYIYKGEAGYICVDHAPADRTKLRDLTEIENN